MKQKHCWDILFIAVRIRGVPGSRITFISDKYAPILLHKPHPRKELLDYQMKQLIDILEGEGLI